MIKFLSVGFGISILALITAYIMLFTGHAFVSIGRRYFLKQ